MYSQKKSIDDFFLTDSDKAFELNQLVREITKSMENMTDPAMIDKYTQMVDGLNGRLEDGNNLTQTDLDILKAQFDLEQTRDKYKD
jgi:hypothetical protein